MGKVGDDMSMDGHNQLSEERDENSECENRISDENGRLVMEGDIGCAVGGGCTEGHIRTTLKEAMTSISGERRDQDKDQIC